MKPNTSKSTSFAKGGSSLGRTKSFNKGATTKTRKFLKEPDAFRTDTGPGAKQEYGKK